MRRRGEEAASGGGNDADRAFLEGMIPHHEGGVELGNAEKSEHDELKLVKDVDQFQSEEAMQVTLAENIVGTQSKEIEDMNDWREAWYGAPFPAGGVPAE